MKRNQSGFSILELAIVVSIISIMAAMAVPTFQNILNQARLNNLANDLRVHSYAINNHAMQVGRYPDSHQTKGSYIMGMEDILSPRWVDRSPVGGYFTWVYNQPNSSQPEEGFLQVVAGSQSPFNISHEEIIKLDRKIDDGDAADGRLQVIPPSKIRYYVTGVPD